MDTSLQNKQTVLVIDDSEELLHILQLILEKYGYNVLVRDCPSSIADFVQKVKIDLLLLDVRLRNVSGRFVCKELKSDPKTNYFPIILISASPKYAINYKECGADDFIEKPFSLAELISKVGSQLDAKFN